MIQGLVASYVHTYTYIYIRIHTYTYVYTHDKGASGDVESSLKLVVLVVQHLGQFMLDLCVLQQRLCDLHIV